MKNLKGKFLGYLFIIMVLSLLAINVEAAYYTNENGIEFTKKAYDIVTELYNNEYIKTMTQEDYDFLSLSNIDTNKVNIKTSYERLVSPMGTIHETGSKRISILSNCSNLHCTIVITLQWLGDPRVKSYDLIGSRFYGTEIYSQDSLVTRIVDGTDVTYVDNYKRLSNGAGCSVKLPSSPKTNNLIIDQRFYVLPKGTVYGSYQHAMKNVSLETSKMYRLDVSGYGNVFLFYGDAVDKYDQMGGVFINIKA